MVDPALIRPLVASPEGHLRNRAASGPEGERYRSLTGGPGDAYVPCGKPSNSGTEIRSARALGVPRSNHRPDRPKASGPYG